MLPLMPIRCTRWQGVKSLPACAHIDARSKAALRLRCALLSANGCCAGGHTQVAGATVVPVASSDVAAALVRKAAVARACEATAMNASSSRSHSVFMLAITGRHEASGTALKGALNLVDLAGRCVGDPSSSSPAVFPLTAAFS